MDTVETPGSAPTTACVRGARAGDGGDPSPPARTGCDLVTVPYRQGLEAADLLRLRAGVGPILHDRTRDTLGFLVPAGTADAWDLPGSACRGTPGRGRRVTAEPPVAGAGWLVPPAHGAAVTDPALLRDALGEAARTLEAAARR